MCCKRGSVATYDLQIRSSDAEALRIIDVFEMLSPTAAVASFLIQGLAAEIDLPGRQKPRIPATGNSLLIL